jgi:RNA polymerase sigma-70 factor (ECF subfamily)
MVRKTLSNPARTGQPEHDRPAMADADQTPDQALVTRAQRGDRRALEALVRRYQRPVFRLCFRYVRDADEAADLVQRTFMRAMTKLGDLRAAEVFRTWILRIGANLALNHLRDNARFVPDEAINDGSVASAVSGLPPAPTASERLEAGEAVRGLRLAVETLPTKQRMTLELRVYEELSFREIAEALSTTEGAAKVNFHYAVRNLRTRLAPPDDVGTRKGGGR